MRFVLMSRIGVSGKKVAMVSAMVVLLGLTPLAVRSAEALMTKSIRVPAKGSVRIVQTIGVGVYWDSGCSNPVSSIDWGTIDAGSAKNVKVFFRNEGNAAVTLSIEAMNWNPSTASSYMTFSSNYAGQLINPGGVIQVTLTLSVSSSITGVSSFSFDIVVTASG